MWRNELETLKNKSGMTLKQIATKTNIPESTISRIISGETQNPSFDTVVAIVQCLGGSLDLLCGLKTENDITISKELIHSYEMHIKTQDEVIKHNWKRNKTQALVITIMLLLFAVLFILLSTALYLDLHNSDIGFFR